MVSTWKSQTESEKEKHKMLNWKWKWKWNRRYGYVCIQWTEPHMITSTTQHETKKRLFFCCSVLCTLFYCLFDFKTAIPVSHSVLKHVKMCKSLEYPRYGTMKNKMKYTQTHNKKLKKKDTNELLFVYCLIQRNTHSHTHSHMERKWGRLIDNVMNVVYGMAWMSVCVCMFVWRIEKRNS